jgi:hypothetical protein
MSEVYPVEYVLWNSTAELIAESVSSHSLLSVGSKIQKSREVPAATAEVKVVESLL